MSDGEGFLRLRRERRKRPALRGTAAVRIPVRDPSAPPMKPTAVTWRQSGQQSSHDDHHLHPSAGSGPYVQEVDTHNRGEDHRCIWRYPPNADTTRIHRSPSRYCMTSSPTDSWTCWTTTRTARRWPTSTPSIRTCWATAPSRRCTTTRRSQRRQDIRFQIDELDTGRSTSSARHDAPHHHPGGERRLSRIADTLRAESDTTLRVHVRHVHHPHRVSAVPR